MKPTKCPAKKERGKKSKKRGQGCALEEPGGLWHLTFVVGRLEDLLNHMLGTLDFTNSEHWAPFNFS